MLSLALSLAALAPPVADDVTVLWKGKELDVQSLPADVPEPARECVARWSAWAGANDHRLELDDAGRVLLVAPSWNPGQRRHRELMEATVKRFDALLPAPERKDEPDAPVTGAGTPPSPDQHPEDPEGAPPGLERWLRPADEGKAWGSETRALDGETVALFMLRDVSAYGTLLEQVGRENEHLVEWARAASGFTGFVVEQPLCGAYLLDDPNQEEWNPENELVNRLTQLLVLRRFGQEPYWIVQGIAWCIEQELCGSIYCFPYRQGFVGVEEHKGWDVVLGKRLLARGSGPIEVIEFAEWQRGTYDEHAAKLGWGVIAWLVARKPAELSPWLEELRLVRARENKKLDANGKWERDTNYRIDAATQERILGERFGATLLADAAAHYRAIAEKAIEEERAQAEREARDKRRKRGKD